ncbi:MAG TPA: SRPBCC domain-containing protein [Chitinophagaceae bacterium]|nr:SRPBCC domain-containing protein [Chitinophagaceae bacterium]
MSTQPIVIERTFNVSPTRLWQALTKSEQMKQWYFDLPGFKAEPGYEFSFYAGRDEKKFLHLCKVIEVIPGKKLTHSWRYDGYPGDSIVSFELFPEGENTRLRLTHSGLETFGDNPDFAKSNFVEGWTNIIVKRLQKHLEA